KVTSCRQAQDAASRHVAPPIHSLRIAGAGRPMTSQKTSEMPGKLGQALRAESKRSRVPASFRDRDGFVYFDAEHGILRQVNRSYQQSFEQLMKSGLYDLLVKREMLVAHEEESLSRRLDDEAFAVLRPNRIPFISYPYEWSFNALKDAA